MLMRMSGKGFESKGIKNELGAKVKYAFGDGDVTSPLEILFQI